MTIRTRSRSSSSGSQSKSWKYTRVDKYDDGDTGKPIVSSLRTSVGTTAQTTESMTDTVTQQFKKVSSEGGIVLSPMTKSTVTTVDLPISYNHAYRQRYTGKYPGWSYYTITGERFSSEILNTSFASPPSLGSVADRAVSEAFANISLSETQLWASLGEAKETLGMIRDSYKLAKGLLTRDLRTIKRLRNPKEIANAWMALRYGIRPLYYEINGYLKALHAKPPSSCRQTFRGFVLEKASSDRIASKNVDSNFVVSTKQKIDVTVRARAGVLTDVEFKGAPQILGLWEIPQSAWELVPFSFIIDWFVNVGTVIASWSPKPGFKVLGSWVVIETTTKKTATLENAYFTKPCSTPPINSCYADLSHSFSPLYQIESVTVQRMINPSRPLLPSFDVNLDYLKILDLAIIMKNLFNKR